jgi:L-2-hydroxyglutarate oxidase
MGIPPADVAVVGGGIVGLATAYQLLLRDPSLRVVVFDKEAKVGLHQSSHNSGVLHAGIYYAPGSLKARLCSSGKVLMERFAAEHEIPVLRRGKVVVAVDSAELGRFRALAERAEANGVPGLRVIGPEELREIEPHVAGIRALHSPHTGVIDFGLVCNALAGDIRFLGGDVRTSAAVVRIDERGGSVRVHSLAGDVVAGAVVVCAGLQADRLARASGGQHGDGDVRIVPFRGSWYSLRPPGGALVRGNIYPVPNPRLPFLGVHLTRRIDGSVWVGPNAVLAGGRESYSRGTVNFRDVAATAGFPGAWRLGRRHLRTGALELYRDRVRRAYLRALQRYVPEVGLDDLVPGPTGIRAQAVRGDGSMIDDFLIEGTRRVIHVLSAPSPAATSSLAIGQVLAGQVAERLQPLVA